MRLMFKSKNRLKMSVIASENVVEMDAVLHSKHPLHKINEIILEYD